MPGRDVELGGTECGAEGHRRVGGDVWGVLRIGGFHDGGLLCAVGWVDCAGEGVDACEQERVVDMRGVINRENVAVKEVMAG